MTEDKSEAPFMDSFSPRQRLQMWWWRQWRLLCPRGWHSYSLVGDTAYQHVNSPWFQSWSLNGVQFSKHCDHCGKWKYLK